MMEGCRLVSSGSEAGGVGSMLESGVTGEGREMVLSSRRTLRGCGEPGGRKEVKNSARLCVQWSKTQRLVGYERFQCDLNP